MNRIPINSATREQLASFAETVLGMEIASTWNANTIRAKMQAAWDKDYIEVAPAEPAMPPRQIVSQGAVPGTGKRMARITIPVSDLPGGQEPVPVSVNGRSMWVPRGEMVEIPYHIFEALDHAKMTVYEASHDIKEPLGRPRDVHRFPFTIHGIDPAPAESQAA